MLQDCEVCVGYSPMGGEPLYGDFLKQNSIGRSGMSTLADRALDPKTFAEFLIQKYSGKKVCVFVPGREFDSSGTRHGRGGGWYDRFLSAVPREWLRVGVLNQSQLSQEKLKRESWDEPMDVLVIRDGAEWKVLAASGK